MDAAAAMSPLFPALARAKQQFLARQTARPPLAAPAPVDTSSAVEATPLLFTRICTATDAELRTVTRELDGISAAVRRAHQQLCADVEAFSIWLVNPHAPPVPPAPMLSPDVLLTDINSACELEPERSHDGHTLAAPSAQVRTDPHEPTPSSPLPPRGRSRAATLALAAVHAHVLQRHIRRFLYSILYTGGPQQLERARRLRQRVALAHVWRVWRTAVRRRCRIGRRLANCAQRLASGARVHALSTARAVCVRERDGAYAVAKRFHETRALCVALRAWALATAMSTTMSSAAVGTTTRA